MKYRLKYLLTLLGFCLAFTLIAQESWTFKQAFRPESTYRSDLNMDIDMTMLMDFPEEMQKEMPADTMSMVMGMQFEVLMKTGAVTDGGLPFVVSYDSVAMVGAVNGDTIPMDGQEEMLRGFNIKGRYVNQEMVLDSLGGEAMTAQVAQSVQQNLEGLAMMVEFPETPLRIGDSFSQTVTKSVSTATGNNVDMEVVMHYTLESVEGEVAVFRTREEYDFGSLKDQNFDISGRGEGGGTMRFSLAQNYILSYVNDSDLDMLMDMSATTGMETKMDMSSRNRIKSRTTLVD